MDKYEPIIILVGVILVGISWQWMIMQDVKLYEQYRIEQRLGLTNSKTK